MKKDNVMYILMKTILMKQLNKAFSDLIVQNLSTHSNVISLVFEICSWLLFYFLKFFFDV